MPALDTNRTITQITITQGGAGAIDLVAAPGAGLKVFVVAYVVAIATTGQVQWFEGTGPTALSGNMNLLAGTPHIVVGNGMSPVLQTNTANVKLTLTSTTGIATGYIRYFIAPES